MTPDKLRECPFDAWLNKEWLNNDIRQNPPNLGEAFAAGWQASRAAFADEACAELETDADMGIVPRAKAISIIRRLSGEKR